MTVPDTRELVERLDGRIGWAREHKLTLIELPMAEAKGLREEFAALAARVEEAEREQERLHGLYYEDALLRETQGKLRAAEARVEELTRALRIIELWPFDAMHTAEEDCADMKECARAVLVRESGGQP